MREIKIIVATFEYWVLMLGFMSLPVIAAALSILTWWEMN